MPLTLVDIEPLLKSHEGAATECRPYIRISLSLIAARFTIPAFQTRVGPEYQ